jgi:hypothetical protein
MARPQRMMSRIVTTRSPATSMISANRTNATSSQPTPAKPRMLSATMRAGGVLAAPRAIATRIKERRPTALPVPAVVVPAVVVAVPIAVPIAVLIAVPIAVSRGTVRRAWLVGCHHS